MNQNNDKEENSKDDEEIKYVTIRLDIFWFNAILIPLLLLLNYFRGNMFIEILLYITTTIFFFGNMLMIYLIFK